MTWVSELNAASVWRRRSARLARSSSPALMSKNHSNKVPGASGSGAGPPRTSNTREEPATWTFAASLDAEARADSTSAVSTARSAATIPLSFP